MTQSELLVTNFEEVRRRSLILWSSLPEDKYFWKPDNGAIHALEMVRHVLECDEWFRHIIVNNGNVDTYDQGIWENRPYINLQDELEFSKPYRENLIKLVKSYSVDDLSNIKVTYGKRQPRKLGDFLLRAAYHEAVHAGNFIAYLRAMGVDRPWIWD
jgi:uncharacterized damage-inducible protein DinB